MTLAGRLVRPLNRFFVMVFDRSGWAPVLRPALPPLRVGPLCNILKTRGLTRSGMGPVQGPECWPLRVGPGPWPVRSSQVAPTVPCARVAEQSIDIKRVGLCYQLRARKGRSVTLGNLNHLQPSHGSDSALRHGGQLRP